MRILIDGVSPSPPRMGEISEIHLSLKVVNPLRGTEA